MVCSRCLEVFEDPDRYDAHSQSTVPCFRGPNSRLDGITQRQSKAISKKSKRSQSEEEQWFAVWDIIFPDTPRPASAYLDSELSEDLNSFQEYWTNRGHDVLLSELNRSGVWVLSPDEREVQAGQILARGLNSIYEQWAGLRRDATAATATTTTTPFLGIAISPSLTNPSAMQSSTAASFGSSIPSASQVVQANMALPNQAVVDNSATENSQVEGVDLQYVQSHTDSYTLPSDAIITWPPQTGETLGTQSNVEGGELEFVLDEVLDPPFTLDSAFDFEVGQ
ncbi:hypothetical protein E8E14_008626 [Neopestalotiopsis sp. 37M]|nr:hypothetical protein E8E14_008626 [Neopestalotiopsis sp. 37M]